MRLTYSDLIGQFLRNTNQVGSSDPNLIADFNLHLGQRYQLMLAKLKNYRTELYNYNFLTGMNAIDLTANLTVPIASVVSTGTTATVTTTIAHGFANGDKVNITGTTLNYTAAGVPTSTYGINNGIYNGVYTVTVTSSTTFTYTLTSTANSIPAMPAQYFPYPTGEVTIDGIFITVNSVNFPLRIIDTMMGWEQLNAILIQASALPQFYFPRRDDFGIWPIPQATYQGTMMYHYRDRNLSVSDYNAGTVSLTQYSNVVTGSGTIFTPAMVGRWFTITDTTVQGQGYWYRVTGYTDATHVILSTNWNNASCTGSAYRIGETPELPEEGHITLCDGATADFYGGMRYNPTSYAQYSNLFWTGDAGNPLRKEGNTEIAGGLIGLVNRYSDRDDTRLIKKRPHLNPLQFKAFATSLSS